MEEVLAILGFSFGASLGIGAVRSVTDGSRPILRNVLKAGIRAWDVVANATTPASPAAAPAKRSRRSAEPRKIAIAHK